MPQIRLQELQRIVAEEEHEYSELNKLLSEWGTKHTSEINLFNKESNTENQESELIAAMSVKITEELTRMVQKISKRSADTISLHNREARELQALRDLYNMILGKVKQNHNGFLALRDVLRNDTEEADAIYRQQDATIAQLQAQLNQLRAAAEDKDRQIQEREDEIEDMTQRAKEDEADVQKLSDFLALQKSDHAALTEAHEAARLEADRLRDQLHQERDKRRTAENELAQERSQLREKDLEAAQLLNENQALKAANEDYRVRLQELENQEQTLIELEDQVDTYRNMFETAKSQLFALLDWAREPHTDAELRAVIEDTADPLSMLKKSIADLLLDLSRTHATEKSLHNDVERLRSELLSVQALLRASQEAADHAARALRKEKTDHDSLKFTYDSLEKEYSNLQFLHGNLTAEYESIMKVIEVYKKRVIDLEHFIADFHDKAEVLEEESPIKKRKRRIVSTTSTPVAGTPGEYSAKSPYVGTSRTRTLLAPATTEEIVTSLTEEVVGDEVVTATRTRRKTKSTTQA